MMRPHRDKWLSTWGLPKAILLICLWPLAGSAANGAQEQKTQPRLSDEEATQLRAEADRDFTVQNHKEALAKYLRIYPQFANDFAVNQRIGWLYLNSPTGEWQRAVPYLRKARSLDPASVDVLRDLAVVTSWARLFDEAVPLYRELVRISPAAYHYRLQFARMLSWAGQNTEAVAQYREYLGRAPSDLTARVELGNVLGRQKDLPGASEQYNYVLRFQPRNTDALLGLARMLAWSGQLRPALDQVDKVLKARPRHFDARVLKAFILTWQGETDEAKTLFTALAREDPRNGDVQQGLRAIAEQEKARAAGRVPPPEPAPPAPPAQPEALRLAEEAEAQARYGEAITHYREHLAKFPDDTDAQFRLARVLGWNKQYAEAESMLGDWLRSNPDNPEGLLQLARVLRWDQKYPEAADAYGKALALRPQDVAARLELAQLHFYMKNYPQALDEFRRALVLQTDSIEAQKGVVQALIWNGELERAREELQELARRHPDDPEIPSLQQQLQTSELERARSRGVASPEVEKYFRSQVEEDPGNVQARLRLADVYLARNEYPAAIQELRAASHAKPDDDTIKLQLGRVLSWNQEYEEAVGIFREHLKKHPEDTATRLQLARVLSWEKAYDASVGEYQAIVRENPNNSEARLEMARVLSWSKRYNAALQEFDVLARQDQQDFDVLLGKARIYSYESRWRDSLETYDAALAVRPGDREALTGKAQVLLWSGEPAPARDMLAQLHAESPDDITVMVSLASAENSLGRPDRALKLLEQAEAARPGNADVRTLRGQIRARLRPELRLGWNYLRDTDLLNIWAYRLDFRFSLHPRLRSYLKVDYLPSSGLAGLFGYPVYAPGGPFFAPNVPLDPFVPSPTLLTETDFPAGFLLPGGTRIGQSAGQFQAGGSMQVNQWFSWTAGAGAIELRHGGPELDLAGFASTRTRFIYNASPTFHLGRHVQITLGSSRQYWAYTPKSTAQEIHVDELSGSLVLTPNSRSRIALGYYHRQISPAFLIPDIFVYDPVTDSEVLTFEGRSFKKIGNGGSVTATGIVFRGEKGEFEVGYDAMAFGYNHPPDLASPEFYLNAGVFTPSFYQRHAGMVRITWRPSRCLYWDIHGSAGVQQIRLAPDVSFSPTGGTRLDFNLSDNATLSLGYDYFSAASAFQAVIIRAPTAAYHSNNVTASLHLRF